MTPEQAKATLVAYLGGNGRPILVDAVLDALLSRFRLRDALGRQPDDEGWEGDWALNAAAAEGWGMKAGMVAADFNFSADDASFSKGDVMAKCLEMQASYAAKDRGALRDEANDYDYRTEHLWL